MPEIPTPAHVLHALAPLWPPLYTALEWATQQTRAYFDAEGTPIDRHLAPSLVRYQAKRSLARLGHNAQEDEGEAYAFQTLPNNGLSLSYRGDLLYVLRILKALEGQLPAPGASRARQAFWHQQLIFDYAAPSAAQLRPSLNLLVLWETDAAYTLRRLSAGVSESRGPNPGVGGGLLDDRDSPPQCLAADVPSGDAGGACGGAR
jgi:hypothetical protein